MYNVFISSTSRDLQAYRAATIDVCNRLGLVPIGMEFFGAMGAGATAGSKRQLDEADVYVGIFAHRYGYIEKDHARSVTELEYDYAGERGLERLCFLADPAYPWPEKGIESDKTESLRRFKERLEHEQIRVLFTTVADYQFKLLDTLSKWLLAALCFFA